MLRMMLQHPAGHSSCLQRRSEHNVLYMVPKRQSLWQQAIFGCHV